MTTRRYEAPGTGAWTLDSTHFPRPVTAYFAGLFPEPFMRGFKEGSARYGLLFSHLEPGLVNGFVYYRDQGVDAADEDEIGRRFETAADALESRLWRDDLAHWDREVKPDSVRRNRSLQGIDLAALDSQGLLAHLAAARENAIEMVYRHHKFSIPSIIPVGLYLANAGTWTGLDAGTILAPLKGFSPVSLGARRELAELAAALSNAGIGADELSAAPPRETLDGLVRRDDAVGEAARAFVAAIGARLAGGYDIGDPCAIEMPEMLLATVRAALDAPPEASPERASESAERVRAAVPPEHRERFEELLGDARLMNRLRDERGIYNDLWGTGIARAAVLEAGRRLAASGRLAWADLALDATHDELTAMLHGEPTTSAEELEERARLRTSTPSGEAPPTLGPPPPPPPPLDGLPPGTAQMMGAIGAAIGEIFGQRPATTSRAISGRPVSPGVYQGTARVITSPADSARLRPGDVLVTPSTSAGFNVVLPLLGAIVTDRGGQLSHAAIVAREFGIPAVVGTLEATEIIVDGAQIRVDGTAGTVEIV